MTKYSAICN